MLLSEFNFFRGIKNLTKAVGKSANKNLYKPLRHQATTISRSSRAKRNIASGSMADGLTSVVQRGAYKPTTPRLRNVSSTSPKTSPAIKATKATPKAQRTSLQQYRDRQSNKYG